MGSRVPERHTLRHVVLPLLLGDTSAALGFSEGLAYMTRLLTKSNSDRFLSIVSLVVE